MICLSILKIALGDFFAFWEMKNPHIFQKHQWTSWMLEKGVHQAFEFFLYVYRYITIL